nr:reverse transcriptase domain-containing protein [Tanacetum cinerariifolium]
MNPEGMEFTYALRFRFNATNNEAEYEALIAGLRIASQMGIQNLHANVDSKLVANQVLVEELKEKAIDKKEVLAEVEEEGHTWMTPVYEYLMEGSSLRKRRKQGLYAARQEDMPLGHQFGPLIKKERASRNSRVRNKAKMEGYYNARVRSTNFCPGDFVYRNNEASHVEDGGKLGPKWEGPYEVTEVLGKGAYKLRDRNGYTLPRTWNIRNLKKCYIHEM